MVNVQNRSHHQETLQPGRDIGGLLAEHHRLYAAGFTWSPEPGRTASFESKYYLTDEACDRATARLLRENGYERPKFWQWWRWGESRPNKRVTSLLTASPASQE